jgi:hypothetical protein
MDADIKSIRDRIAQIEKVKDDFERAHSEEDSLHQDVLRAISRGRDPAKMRQLAREALKSTEIDFFRFCA